MFGTPVGAYCGGSSIRLSIAVAQQAPPLPSTSVSLSTMLARGSADHGGGRPAGLPLCPFSNGFPIGRARIHALLINASTLPQVRTIRSNNRGFDSSASTFKTYHAQFRQAYWGALSAHDRLAAG